MKKTLVALTAFVVTCSAFAQGVVVFNNRVPGLVDAPVIRGPGLPNPEQGAGEGYSAQLLLVGPGGVLTPLTPATTFRTSSAAATPYVNGVDVTVPGVPPGSPATLRFVAYETAAGSFEAATSPGTSFIFGLSSPITVILGGGTLPPANLIGLQGFPLSIPEPSTIALVVMGAAAFLLRRRK